MNRPVLSVVASVVMSSNYFTVSVVLVVWLFSSFDFADKSDPFLTPSLLVQFTLICNFIDILERD
jgi:hypothetical protein